MLSQTAPLTPKNPDGPLQVIILGRISTPYQDQENIPASYRFAEDYLHQIYAGSVEIRYLGEQASGMLAERSTILEADELIATGKWDVVIVEDLSRTYRNPRFQWAFVQDCVDRQTRVICIADNIDTADEYWEAMMHTAALRHGLIVPDTRRRVRRTATHSFNNGGMVMKFRYGYRKLSIEEAASDPLAPMDYASSAYRNAPLSSSKCAPGSCAVTLTTPSRIGSEPKGSRRAPTSGTVGGPAGWSRLSCAIPS
jgi:DNA invertase Pin-like site-specific DNA recombinase